MIIKTNKTHEKLRALRKTKGLNCSQLAKVLNVGSRKDISKWELGGSLPSLENLLKLSKYYGYSINSLIDTEIYLEIKIPNKTIKWEIKEKR